MNRKALETIKQYHLITAGDCVCVALSGGADSVALFHFLRSIHEEWSLRLMACHLNHQLRGEAAEADVAFVRALCEQCGVPLIVERHDVAAIAKERGCSLEEAGRYARYRLFEKLADNRGCKVATAHTLSDGMETVLLNMARGTGVAGLRGIPPVRDYVIRPLIHCTRQDIEDYCSAGNYDYVTDQTNLDDTFTRNKLRHKVVPVLYEVNPAADRAFLRLMENATDLDELLTEQAVAACKDLERGECRYHIPGFLALRNAVAHRMLHLLLEPADINLTQERYDTIRELFLQSSGTLQLSRNVYLTWSNDLFSLKIRTDLPNPMAGFETPLDMGTREGNVLLPDGRFFGWTTHVCEQIINFGPAENLVLKYSIDCDKIYGTVHLRTRKTGDKIRLSGRNASKSLKKLYNESKVPRHQRDRLLVLCDDNGVLWVEGFGVDERCRLSSKTQRYLQLHIDPANEQ